MSAGGAIRASTAIIAKGATCAVGISVKLAVLARAIARELPYGPRRKRRIRLGYGFWQSVSQSYAWAVLSIRRKRNDAQ